MKNNVAKNFPNIVNKMREIMDNEHLESEIFKFEFEKRNKVTGIKSMHF